MLGMDSKSEKKKKPPKYIYSEENFAIFTNLKTPCEFSNVLQAAWTSKMRKGQFRYNLNEALKTKHVPGHYGFIAQLNVKRATDRRKPQNMLDVIMPFDFEKFHFGKVNFEEIMLELKPMHWAQESSENGEAKHLVIINSSPLEFCSSLLVPYVEKCYPQVLNFDGLRLAVEVMLINYDPAFKIGMNSLCGYASVNHLHFHLYYLTEKLYLQNAAVKHLVGDCFQLSDYPAMGFAFQLTDENMILPVVRSVMKLVEFLLQEKVAHNIFIMRGKVFNSPEEVYNAIRIFVWARKPVYGIKGDLAFNSATCELAGHLIIKDEKDFENLTEDAAALVLKNACNDIFMQIRDKVKRLYV